MPNPTHAAWDRLVTNVVRVAEALVRLRQRTGTFVHLDIEPEPDCLIETSDELIEFFNRRLLPDGGPRLAAALGCEPAEADAQLRDHVRMCLDCCHFAVEYEDPEAALARLQQAGIQVGRVQLSSALKVTFPENGPESAGLVDRLRRFADSTYLHQVIERRGAELRHVPDLGEALDGPAPLPGTEWRIHFHVPLFTAEYDGLGSTQDYVRHGARHRLADAVRQALRDRDLHLGRAARRAESRSPRFDRTGVPVGTGGVERIAPPTTPKKPNSQLPKCLGVKLRRLPPG